MSLRTSSFRLKAIRVFHTVWHTWTLQCGWSLNSIWHKFGLHLTWWMNGSSLIRSRKYVIQLSHRRVEQSIQMFLVLVEAISSASSLCKRLFIDSQFNGCANSQYLPNRNQIKSKMFCGSKKCQHEKKKHSRTSCGYANDFMTIELYSWR